MKKKKGMIQLMMMEKKTLMNDETNRLSIQDVNVSATDAATVNQSAINIKSTTINEDDPD